MNHSSNNPHNQQQPNRFAELLSSISPWHSGLFFITTSLYLFVALAYNLFSPRRGKLFTTCLVCCVDAFLGLAQSVLIFLYKVKVIFRQEITFKITMWLINACLNASTFTLFWVQRRDFYRQTAVVNNTSEAFRFLENVLLGAFMLLETAKCSMILYGTLRPTTGGESCHLGMPKSSSIAFFSVTFLFKFILFLIMLQPVLRFWDRLRSSNAYRFSFRLRHKVVRPALSAGIYACAGLVHTYPAVLAIRRFDCEKVYKVLFITLQLVPLFFTFTIIWSLGGYRRHLFPFCGPRGGGQRSLGDRSGSVVNSVVATMSVRYGAQPIPVVTVGA